LKRHAFNGWEKIRNQAAILKGTTSVVPQTNIANGGFKS